MASEPPTGSSTRRHGEPPAGYSRSPPRSVSRMKATTVRPVNAPITSASTRNTWSSRCCNLAMKYDCGVLHQLPLVVWPLPLISGECPRRAYLTGLPLDGGSEGSRRIEHELACSRQQSCQRGQLVRAPSVSVWRY